MKAVLDTLPPKMYALESGKEATPIKMIVQDLQTRMNYVVSKIRNATFTGAGDKDQVPALYHDYVRRIAEVLSHTLGFIR